jgi:hypothetical protein
MKFDTGEFYEKLSCQVNFPLGWITLHKDLYAFLHVSEAYHAKYLLDRKERFV